MFKKMTKRGHQIEVGNKLLVILKRDMITADFSVPATPAYLGEVRAWRG